MPRAGSAPRSDEATFGRGARLTLALAVVLLVGPLVVTLVGHDRPTDGWAHTSDPTQLYRLVADLTDQPSPLRAGDIITAIGGEPLLFGYRSAIPDGLQVGQTLRYTVLRDGQPMEADVPLVSYSPLMAVTYLVRSTQLEITSGTDASSLVLPLLTLLIVGFAFARRPGNQAARLLLLGFAYFAGANWFAFANWDPFVYAYPAPLAFVSLLGSYGWAWLFFPALTHLALAFPTRLWPLRRFPRLLPVLLYGLPALLMLLAAPLAMAGRAEAATLDTAAALGAVALFVVTLLFSLIHNFRAVRDPIARAQFRWIALGLGAGWGVGITLTFIGTAAPVLQPQTELLSGWLVVLLPLSLAVAITRHRLFDIDVILNRALVYTLLTAALAVVYLGGVVMVQTLLRAVAGQESDLAIVAATLAVVACFQPLRARVQALIDRLFFRRKYDAEAILATYGALLRDEVDLNRISGDLLGVVGEAVQPAHTSLWLREPEGGQ